jgi:hypothetical protein
MTGFARGEMSIPAQFKVAREGIDPSVSQEYIEFADSIDFGQDKDILVLGRGLYDRGIPPIGKKECLVRLARQGTPEAYKIIERYLEIAEGALKEWGVLALWECWTAVEAELFDEEVGVVVTGLGGEGRRLRYFVAVGFSEGEVIARGVREGIERGFGRACEELGAILEGVEMRDKYTGIRLLIPTDVAVADVVERGIAKSNKEEAALESRYYVTNVRIPEVEEIESRLLEAGFGA